MSRPCKPRPASSLFRLPKVTNQAEPIHLPDGHKLPRLDLAGTNQPPDVLRVVTAQLCRLSNRQPAISLWHSEPQEVVSCNIVLQCAARAMGLQPAPPDGGHGYPNTPRASIRLLMCRLPWTGDSRLNHLCHVEAVHACKTLARCCPCASLNHLCHVEAVHAATPGNGTSAICCQCAASCLSMSRSA